MLYVAITFMAMITITTAIVLKGLVLSILWGWFAVPVFNAPSISVPQAIGIALVSHLLTHQYVPSKDSDGWQSLTFLFLGPLFSLLIGWIVKGFMM